jgi:hypothetical protein
MSYTPMVNRQEACRQPGRTWSCRRWGHRRSGSSRLPSKGTRHASIMHSRSCCLTGCIIPKSGEKLSSCNALIAEVAYHFLFLFKHTNVALGFLWICDPKWSLCVCTANLMLVQLQKKLLAWSIRAKHLVEWLWPCRKRRGMFGWWLGDVVCHVYPSVNCE